MQDGPGSNARGPVAVLDSALGEHTPTSSDAQSVVEVLAALQSAVRGAARTLNGAARLRTTAAVAMCCGAVEGAAHETGATLSPPVHDTGSEDDEVDVAPDDEVYVVLATSGDVTWSLSPNDAGKCMDPVIGNGWCAAAVGAGPPCKGRQLQWVV